MHKLPLRFNGVITSIAERLQRGVLQDYAYCVVQEGNYCFFVNCAAIFVVWSK